MIEPEDCYESLQKATRILNETPSVRQYDELELSPSSSRICSICGSWNEAKEGAGLEKLKTGSRSGQGQGILPPPDDMDISEKEWESMNSSTRWYHRNKGSDDVREKVYGKRNDRIQDKREWVNTKKEEVGCERCGYDKNSLALEFHHLDEKYKGVSRMIGHDYSIQRIQQEMEKCVVLCSNCHKIVEHGEVGLKWL